MNAVAILNSQFVQVALPLMLTLSIAAWWNNKRVDDLRSDMNRRFDDANRRFDEIFKRLDRIDDTLKNYGERIVRLEERTSPLTRI
jgi:hypothetical protein